MEGQRKQSWTRRNSQGGSKNANEITIYLRSFLHTTYVFTYSPDRIGVASSHDTTVPRPARTAPCYLRSFWETQNTTFNMPNTTNRVAVVSHVSFFSLHLKSTTKESSSS